MPRKKGIQAGDKIDFLFRCQTKADTRDGKLLRYLQSKETELPLREMLLCACAAFWMPFAHKYLNDLSPEELQQSVDRAIYQLQTQILYLEASFGARRMGAEIPPRVELLTSSVRSLAQPQSLDSTPEVAIAMPSDFFGVGEWQDLDF